eukprot:gene10067-7193_t
MSSSLMWLVVVNTLLVLIATDILVVAHSEPFLTDERHRGLTNVVEKLSSEDSETARCKTRYGQRGFLQHRDAEQAAIPPPLLYSLPGSGNTWTRLLIEYATGVLSGSFYNDVGLTKVFPGELICNTSVSVAKAHPMDHSYASLFHPTKPPANKCARRGGIELFTRVILIVRHPLDAIWSEFLRRKKNSHVGQLTHGTFNTNAFLSYFAEAAKMYARVYTADYTSLRSELSSSDLFYLRYEDLHDSSRQVGLLTSLVQFLHLDNRTVNLYPHAMPPTDRIKCAFRLAEHKEVHRPKPPVDDAHAPTDQSDFVTITDAYLGTSAAVMTLCRSWSYLTVALEADRYPVDSFVLMHKTYNVTDLCHHLTLPAAKR